MTTILRFILFFLLAPAFAIVAQAAGAAQYDFRIVDVSIRAESVVLECVDSGICNYDSSGSLLQQLSSLDGKTADEDGRSGYGELEASGAVRPVFAFWAGLDATNRVPTPSATPAVPRGRAPEFQSGQLTESGVLRQAENYLGAGYREVSPGRYVSADGTRQFRYGAHETRNATNHHAHFESLEKKIGFLHLEDDRSLLQNIGDYFGATASGFGQGAFNATNGFRNAAQGIGQGAALIPDQTTRELAYLDIKTLAGALSDDPCLAKILARQIAGDAAQTLSDPDQLSKAIANLSAGGAISILTGSGSTRLLNSVRKLSPDSVLKIPDGVAARTTPTPSGQITWPPNRGFVAGEGGRASVLPGQTLDRFGGPGGSFLSPAGTPASARSLAPGGELRQLHSYEVLRPFEAGAGRASPWFNQPGGGLQFDLGTQTVQDLVNAGILRPIP